MSKLVDACLSSLACHSHGHGHGHGYGYGHGHGYGYAYGYGHGMCIRFFLSVVCLYVSSCVCVLM